MKKHMTLGLVLGLVALAGFVTVRAIAAGCGDGQMAGCSGPTQVAQAGHDNGAMGHGEAAPTPASEHAKADGMRKMCQDCSTKLEAVATSLDAAKKAADAGDAKAAAAEIDKAIALVKEAQDNMKKMMAGAATGAKSAVINARCPIMGGAVKPESLTDALTREHKGQKIGFCCGGCPAAWTS